MYMYIHIYIYIYQIVYTNTNTSTYGAFSVRTNHATLCLRSLLWKLQNPRHVNHKSTELPTKCRQTCRKTYHRHKIDVRNYIRCMSVTFANRSFDKLAEGLERTGKGCM